MISYQESYMVELGFELATSDMHSDAKPTALWSLMKAISNSTHNICFLKRKQKNNYCIYSDNHPVALQFTNGGGNCAWPEIRVCFLSLGGYIHPL